MKINTKRLKIDIYPDKDRRWGYALEPTRISAKELVLVHAILLGQLRVTWYRRG